MVKESAALYSVQCEHQVLVLATWDRPGATVIGNIRLEYDYSRT